MLNWLGEIIQAALRVIPRFAIIRATHSGVAFVRGKKAHVAKPGLLL